MPGIISQMIKSGVGVALGDVVKYILPFLRLLIKAKVFIPTLILGGLGAGVYYDKITGDIAAVIGGLVVIALLVFRYINKER